MIFMNIDLGAIVSLQREFQPKIEQAFNDAAKDLALMSYAHVLEQAQSNLHSTRDRYVAALHIDEKSPGTWIISLDKSAMWIEEGLCVIYGNSHKPTVLTPDGEISIDKIKVGMLVLNKDAKWTKIVKIHDNLLFDFCLERLDEDLTQSAFNYKSTDLSRRSHKKVMVRCTNCNRVRAVTKYDLSRKEYLVCDICCKTKKIVKIHISKGQGHNLWVTADHLILTQNRGWVAAKDLTDTDLLLAPAWGKCAGCESKILWGKKNGWCSSGCGTRQSNFRKLTAGKHVSQNPNWLANVYKKQIANCGRVSGAEEKMAKMLTELGQTVSIYGDGDADWVRQFPIKSSVDSLGRQKYYFVDFYSKKLKLALEVDGKAFHIKSKDDLRDAKLKALGIQTIRLPAKMCYKPFQLKNAVSAILANHSGEIEMVPVPITVTHISPSRDFPLNRRWDITVENESSFVCDGVVVHNSEHEMIDDLLKSPKAKMARDGSKYLVVPFQHNKGPTAQTRAQQDLTNTIKAEMQRRKIPYGKLETDTSGKPKLGLLHSFDILKQPTKTHQGPGQGHGPIGHVRQGTTGIPFLQGVRVYQKEVQDKASGKSKVVKNIMTFRVVSSKHKGTGKWIYPGLEGRRFFEECTTWALQQWDTKIVPDILSRLSLTL